jgi:hypothetical protein
LQRDATPEAEELKTVLTRLSGKSRKRGKPPTARILLSGLFVLLQVLDYLGSMGNDLNQIAKLRVLLKKSLPNFIKDGEILLLVEGWRAAQPTDGALPEGKKRGYWGLKGCL